jgi:serine/threonine-protein kinase
MPSAPLLGGRYEVHAEIGVGGMATVHLARQRGAAGFSRVVAVKRMHPHLAKDPEVVAMFLDEARLASRVDHANVVGISDVVASGGEVFLVMTYVPGASLNRVLARAGAPVPAPIALRIIHDALLGLSAAHRAVDERGSPLCLVHRDVSPHNLLVGSDGTTRVLDFGVAKAEGRIQGRTRTNETKGKLAYMAPEQVLCEPVDARTDVYAAGVCLWEMLSGRRAHEGPDPVIMRAIIEAELPALAAASGHPAAVDELVARATTKDKTRRFQSAEQMATAVEALGVPLAAREAVASWLREHLGPELTDRAEMVAAIEARGTDDLEPAAPTRSDPEPVPPALTPPATSGARPRARGVGVVAAVAIAAAATVALWLLVRDDGGPATAETPSSTTPHAEGSSPASPGPVPDVEPVPSAASAPSTSVEARSPAVPLPGPPRATATQPPTPSSKRRETLF